MPPLLPTAAPLLQVKCMSTGLMTRIRFKETGLLFDKDPRQVRCVALCCAGEAVAEGREVPVDFGLA